MKINPKDLESLSPEEKRALLAQLLKKKAEAAEPPSSQKIPLQSRDAAAFPLSFAQQRLWYLDQLNLGSSVYHLPLLIYLKGQLNVVALEESLNKMVIRHEALRTNFITVEGEPMQITTPERFVPLSVVDINDRPVEERKEEANRLAEEIARQPFNLTEGTLLRFVLYRLGPEEYLFLLVIHHIVVDGWSLGLVVQELTAHYKALVNNEPSALPPLPIQYIDFASWQREAFKGEALAEHVAYWKQQLGGEIATLALPLDYPRPPVQTFKGHRVGLYLPVELSKALKMLSRQEGATLFMTLLAAFKLLLYRYTGQTDVVVGTPIAARNRREVDKLIGIFLNTLVLRTDLEGDVSFHDLLGQVRKVALEAYTHQDVPFEGLLIELQPERDLSRTPLFQVFFNMINLSGFQVQLPNLTADILIAPEVGSIFDLTMYVNDQHSDHIILTLVFNADLFTETRMEEMLAQYEHLLTQIVANPARKLTDFSLTTPQVKLRLPDPTHPLDSAWLGPAHAHFSQQAQQHPERVALVDRYDSWTYQKLERRSNQLAHHLRRHGIQAQDVVAIYGHRSAALVWAILGVLKAGAAFVILDPTYPAPRLVDYLQLASPRAWLQLEAAGTVPAVLEEAVAALSCRLKLPITGAEADNLLSAEPTVDPQINVGADDLAYLSFTSGSTGRPKGILGVHRPLSHFLQWHSQTFGLNETDRFTMLSGLAHDPLLRDIFTPLWLGASLYIPDPQDIETPGQLAAWMTQHQLTITHLTPPMAQLLTETLTHIGEADRSAVSLTTLRFAFFGGDILTSPHLTRLHQLAPQVSCVNFYGATETPQAMGYFIASRPGQLPTAGSIPLGQGIQDVQLLILNSSQQLAGVGEIGEIYIRTPYLTRGYLGDESLTQEKYITNPFTQVESDRLYRSGDLGRYLPDGKVEFVGRRDHQVKIRGFRVELKEVEAALALHPAVHAGVTIVREDIPGDKRVVAYIVPKPQLEITSQELRLFLRERLPDYIIPSHLVMIENLPLTPNGKIDVRALPAPDQTRAELSEAFVVPGTPMEQLIAEVWQEVLGIDQISVYDNFFDLGGHSLLSVKVMAKLEQETGLKLPLTYIGYQTLGQLAALYASQLQPEAAGTTQSGINGKTQAPITQAVSPEPDELEASRLPALTIEPFYFGSSEKHLFGCYHPPHSGRVKDCAVVLCYPLGHEHIRVHRAYQQLATRLARAGFPVLRFDFLGCGDSAGEAEEGQMEQWLADIATAVDQVKKRSGLSQVCLIGLRLGASLAMLAGAGRADISNLVLWEPIIEGFPYLEELTAQHQKTLWRFLVKPKVATGIAEKPTELLGFPMTEALSNDLEKLNLLTVQPSPTQNILIIEGGETLTAAPLNDHLRQLDSRVTHKHLLSFEIWLENPDKGLVPTPTLQAIITWLSEVH